MTSREKRRRPPPLSSILLFLVCLRVSPLGRGSLEMHATYEVCDRCCQDRLTDAVIRPLFVVHMYFNFPTCTHTSVSGASGVVVTWRPHVDTTDALRSGFRGFRLYHAVCFQSIWDRGLWKNFNDTFGYNPLLWLLPIGTPQAYTVESSPHVYLEIRVFSKRVFGCPSVGGRTFHPQQGRCTCTYIAITKSLSCHFTYLSRPVSLSIDLSVPLYLSICPSRCVQLYRASCLAVTCRSTRDRS